MASIFVRTCFVTALISLSNCNKRNFNSNIKQVDGSSVSGRVGVSASSEIAAMVKTKLVGISDSQLRALVRHEYMKLHLQDRSGNWILPEAAKMSDFLLPSNLSMSTINNFIDVMAKNTEENPYMMAFLDAARQRSFPVLKKRFDEEGATIIPRFIAAAFAFEQITLAELNDPLFIEALSNHWQKERERAGVSMKQTGIFGFVKLLSVEQPIRKIIEFHKTKKLDPAFLRGFLSLNIFEAIVADKVTKHPENSDAAWPLFNNPASDAKANELLGTGPAIFSPDGKKIEIRYAMTKQWDDLYQVWNMAFISQIGSYPMWIPKLLIPTMSGYKDRPQEYIYRRTLTLYTTLHHNSLAMIEDAKDGIPTVDWKDDALTQLWGEINLKSAQDYLSRVKAAK